MFRQFVIQCINIMAKELSEPGCCQVNHLMNDLKGNSEDTEIYFRRISLFIVSLDVPWPSRRISYQVTCYKVKWQERATAFSQVR